jgi:hypothetical protein
MPFPWPELFALAGAVVWATPLLAQQGREIGLQAIATASDPAAGVLGGYGAERLSNRSRVSGFLGAGVSGDRVAWRGEILAHFLLNPEKQRGTGFYLAGGVAAARRSTTMGYLVLTVGLEARPRAASGWVLEAGLGGGARFGVGYRWRHHAPGAL